MWGDSKKTQVDKSTTKVTLAKIVKFSYLQSLAIEGGLGTSKDLAGETEAINTKNATEFNKYIDRKTFASAPIRGRRKKITTHTAIDLKDSGWSLVKTWNQPQFDVIRYAIGIKELIVTQFTYVPVSEVVSTPWGSPKEISKIVLLVDQFIPSEFPAGGQFIEYYIKPDVQDVEWIRINPLGLPTVFTTEGKIIPRIINFNTERPAKSKLEDSFISTDAPVKTIRFRAVLKRPDTIVGKPDISANAYTPVLKSYRLLITPRGGLGT